MYGTTGTDTQLTLLEQLSHLIIGGPCYSLLKGNVMMKSKPTKQQLLKRFDDMTDDRTTYVNQYTAYGAKMDTYARLSIMEAELKCTRMLIKQLIELLPDDW